MFSIFVFKNCAVHFHCFSAFCLHSAWIRPPPPPPPKKNDIIQLKYVHMRIGIKNSKTLFLNASVLFLAEPKPIWDNIRRVFNFLSPRRTKKGLVKTGTHLLSHPLWFRLEGILFLYLFSIGHTDSNIKKWGLKEIRKLELK